MLPSSKPTGLARLQIYASDSDSENAVSSGDESCVKISAPSTSAANKDEDTTCGRNKRRRICSLQSLDDEEKSVSLSFPIPRMILQMFSEGNTSANETDAKLPYTDDPSVHLGKIRSFPHERGNWASYLYIPCQETLSGNINKLIDQESKHLETLVKAPIYLIDDKHLSISRTHSFRHHWIELFVRQFKETMKDCRSIELYLDGFNVYVNDESTRTFIGLKVISTEQLMQIVETCDECLMEFQLEPYYKHPSFHISCAWMLGDTAQLMKDTLIPTLNAKWNHIIEKDAEHQILKVDRIEFKTGNKLYQFSVEGD